MRARVVVTGLGCISSFGLGHASLVHALMAGRSGVVPITAFDTSSCRSHCAATIDGFDPTAFIAPLKLRRVDGVGRLALGCARLLVDDAALRLGADGSDEIGMALGTYTAGMDSLVEYLQGLHTHGPVGAPALLFSNTVSNAPASVSAIEYGLRGPNVTFNQREASSLAAIAYAVGLVADGRVTAMMSGGVDRIEETFFKVQDRFGPLARQRGVDDLEVARPFDRERRGFVLGEAGVMLLLESADAAAARGVRSYGEILGIGMTASRADINAWPKDGAGIAAAMRQALEEAALSVDEVDMVFAAANGSRQLDAIEAEAMAGVFGARALPVVAIKGAIGESGAAGAAALAAGLLTLPAGVVPPTVGFARADPACVVHVSREPQAVSGSTFLVNSVASGGTTYSIVARAATERRSVTIPSGGPEAHE
jgi:3-oxoacyl-[acyl-carrier-protein] synthase II